MMARIFASCPFFLVFLLFISAVPHQTMAATTCELATRGGGCPNVNECIEVCRPCYRGIGKILVYCRAAGGEIPFDECMCRFTKGSPCNPPAPPRCPKLWPSLDADALNGTTTHGTHNVVYLNRTHALIDASA